MLRRPTDRVAWLTAIAVLTLLAVAGAPSEVKAADEAAWLFDPDAVVEIDLGLSEVEIAALEADPDEYQAGTFALRVDGVVQGPPLGEVGIRLKGGQGSFRPLSQKAAFKVKFDEYVDGQTFFGLEKLTLNNMVQDPSMVHETLAYELFRAVGLPASRTGYAFVRVNDAPYGLYLNVETLDKVSLPRWFESTQHLYEADVPGVDVEPGGAAAFEVDRGDDENLADLEALIAAANAEAGDWSEGMAAVADLEQMTRHWAVERYVGHWDGYAGQTELPHLAPNNYYLHSDAGGVFRILPWGTDQTWIDGIGFGEPAGGLLFNRCLADESCEALYVDALEEVHAALPDLALGRHGTALLGLLAPYRELEQPSRREETLAEIAASIEATCTFVAARPAELAGWLEEAGRSVADPREEPPCHLPFVSTTGAGEAPAAAPAAAVTNLWIGRPRLLANGLLTRFVVPGPGRVRLFATARIGQRRRIVCAAQQDFGEAGLVELRCQLSAEVLQQLRKSSLPLRVRASFRPPGGQPEVRRRRIVAAQRPA